MRGRGLQGRRKARTEIIRWGEKGVKGIKYTGKMPRDFRGCYTKKFYVYNERRPLLGVDVRDLPDLAKAAGKENLQVRQNDGTYKPLEEPKEPAPAPKSKPKPAKKTNEVSDGN